MISQHSIWCSQLCASYSLVVASSMSDFKTQCMLIAAESKRDEKFVDDVLVLLGEVKITEVEHIQGALTDYTWTKKLDGSTKNFMLKIFEKLAPARAQVDPYSAPAQISGSPDIAGDAFDPCVVDQ